MNLGLENETQEFKQSLAQLDKGLKSLTAMLNKNGHGIVYFGVDDDGNVVGVDTGKKSLMDIRQRVSELIEPKIICEITKHEDEEKRTFIKVEATGSDIPYSCDDRYYIRIVSADEKVSNALLRKMLSGGKADIITQMKSEIDSLTFSGMCAELQRHNIHATDTPEFRKNYGLYNEEGQYNLVAYLLSDQNDLIIKIMRFAGVNKSVAEERAEYKSQSLLLTVQQVLDYFSVMNKSKKVDLASGIRKETELFNLEAFREAWINACVHNAWGELLPPSIYLYDDRMEIVSYGGLPYGLTKEGFYAGNSKPVNARLFRTFIAADFCEESGHGIPRIVEVYGKEAFSFHDGMLTVTIPFGFEPDSVTARKSKETQRNMLTENQKNVLSYFETHRRTTLQEVADACNLSLGGVKKIVNILQRQDVLERIGAKQKSEWVVKRM